MQQNTPVPLNRRRGVFIYLVSLVILRDRYIGVLVGQIRRQGLHVLVHGLGHIFAVGHGLDYRPGTLDGIAAGEDAGDAGAADLIGLKQTARGRLEVLGAVGDGGAGGLG